MNLKSVIRSIVSRPWYLAILLTAVMLLWMLTGVFRVIVVDENSKNMGDSDARLRVRVENSKAAKIFEEIQLSGKTIPSREIVIKAEIQSRVEKIGAKRGQLVREGELIVGLETRDRVESLEEADALVSQRIIEHDAANKLVEKQFISSNKLAEAAALLEQARATRRRAFINLENTRVVAPFSGKLEDRYVEVGDLVEVGDSIARVIELDPIIVKAEVREEDIHRIHNGGRCVIRLSTEENLDGVIRYISPESNVESRLYAIEAMASNPGSRIPSGMSAEIMIPLGEVKAHQISPALLSLNDLGELGVKTVTQSGLVEFYSINIVKADSHNVWISGLPEETQIISVGQGFAKEGEEVVSTASVEKGL